MRASLAFAALALFAAGSSAHAAPVFATSYDMLNGETGSYAYWDESYNGSGSPFVSGSALSGGLGDLTDGIIAADNWFVTEAPQGAGPYVGWDRITPVISFHFAPGTIVDALTIYVDDSNGAGGVSTPGSVEINGGPAIALADGVSGAPLSFLFTGLNSTGPLTLKLNDGQAQWIFLSEVTFEGRRPTTVPEPATLALAGLAAAAFVVRRRVRR